jgi:D-glycero-beta-D-manno-heptose-7-phosphate kinase
VNNKVFDEEHLYALQEALREKKFVLLSLSGELGLTTPIFSAIRNLSQSPEKDLVVYIKDSKPCPEFVNLLASLHDVDFILVKEDSLTSLCDRITPDEIYDIKEGKLHKIPQLDLLLSSSC